MPTISVPVGALTLSGFAPTVLSPRTVPVPKGALTLTGYAPMVLQTPSSIPASGVRNYLQTYLPHSRQPVGYVTVNGQRLPVEIDQQAWYRFHQVMVDVFLAGVGSLTLADILAAVNAAQQTNAETAALSASVAQLAQQNAIALEATKQVAINNSLTGAATIPTVQTSYTSLP